VGHEAIKTGKAVCTLQTWTGPYGSRRSRVPEFLDNPLSPATFPC